MEETAAQANLNGIMADIREEEAKLKALRFEREAESMNQINAVREEEERKARATGRERIRREENFFTCRALFSFM